MTSPIIQGRIGERLSDHFDTAMGNSLEICADGDGGVQLGEPVRPVGKRNFIILFARRQWCRSAGACVC